MSYPAPNRGQIVHAFIVNKGHFFFARAAEGEFFLLNHKKKLPSQHERFLSLCLRFRSIQIFRAVKFPLVFKKRSVIRGDDHMIRNLCW